MFLPSMLKPAAKAMLVLSTLSCLMLAAPASAAIDMFIKIKGIDGGTLDNTFGKQKASEVVDWSWGLSNSGGKVSFEDFSWSQPMDSAFPASFIGVASGKHFGNATFSARTAGDKPYVFLTLIFTDVVLTSLTTGGSGDGSPFLVNTALRPMKQIEILYKPDPIKEALRAKWILDEGVAKSFRGNPKALAGLSVAAAHSEFTGPAALASPVPEPQTWALFALGLGGLAWAQRRRAAASVRAGS